MKSSYWNGQGKYQAVVDTLHNMIPISGEVASPDENKALEKFRRASNVYYDVFNNGLCNRARDFKPLFGFKASDYKITKVQYDTTGRRHTYKTINFDAIVEPLDRRMDDIIRAAAIEQGLM